MPPQTLYDKIWDEHVVHTEDDGTAVLYIDRHLVHEVTSPQAFEGLRAGRAQGLALSANRRRQPTTTCRPPTALGYDGIADPISQPAGRHARRQHATRSAHQRSSRCTIERQGIVHVIGPEQGATLPGMTVVCGDSHTSTHGAFGALAHGIGTSEVEHVLATQTLLAQEGRRTCCVRVEGKLAAAAARAKDIVLAIIGKIGTAGGTGYTIEFAGSRDPRAQHGRAHDGLQHGDRGRRARRAGRPSTRRRSPTCKGRPLRAARRRVGAGRRTTGARCTPTPARTGTRSSNSTPRRSGRRSPGAPRPRWCCRSTAACPIRTARRTPASAARSSARWHYMALEPNKPIDRHHDRQGLHRLVHQHAASRTCARPRAVVRRSARRSPANVKLAMVVPGSGLREGSRPNAKASTQIFKAAGFEWREPGCSMCLAMNADRLEPGERCASTSNRNFEGRQGAGGRTHLVSPAMAAAAAIEGHFVDVRRLA